MLSDRQLRAALNRVDWNFTRSQTHYGLHALHWYPGTFVPQLPALLIELLSSPGELVFDPFCGVGTALVEALRLGRRAVGVDINPIATRAALAKVRVVAPQRLEAMLDRLLIAIDDAIDASAPHPNLPLLRRKADTRPNVGPPHAELLRPWFHPTTWSEVTAIWNVIQQQPQSLRRLGEIVLSSILKASSSQREHWGYVADNMVPSHYVYMDAGHLFKIKMRDVVAGMQELVDSPLLRGAAIRDVASRVKVITADLRKKRVLRTDSVDLIVTSPPYLNVTDYARSQRLSMMLLDLPLDDVREREIGARYKRKRQSALADYLEDMDKALRHIVPSLKPQRFFCCIVGVLDHDSMRSGVVEELKGLITGHGLVDLDIGVRRRPARQRLRRRDGGITLEEIMIFRRP